MQLGNEKIIDDSIEKLLAGLDLTEQRLFEKLRQILFSFSTKGGNLATDENTAKFIASIKKSVREIVDGSGISKRIDGFVTDFDLISRNTSEVQKALNNIEVDTKLISREKQLAVEQTVFSMKEAHINSRFIEPVRQLLFQSVNQGANVLEVEKVMRDLVLGQKGEKGILTRWAGQAARDAMGQFNGNLNEQIRKEYKLAGYLYVGNLVTDSRRQCARWLGKEFLSYESLADEIAWAMKNGSGMVKTTTADTFSCFRGGYNCRHEAIPANGPLTSNIAVISKGSAAGIPISKAITITDSDIKSIAEEGLAIIDEVHGDGELPDLTVSSLTSSINNGDFHVGKLQIRIKPDGPHPLTTLAHEVGHFLDNRALAAKGVFASHDPGGVLAPVMKRLSESTAIKRFLDIKRTGRINVAGQTIQIDRSTLEMVDYFLQPHEQWARAYAQFIAEISKNKKMMDAIEGNAKERLGYFTTQWSSEDFTPIREEMIAVFKKIRWMI